MPPRVAYTCTTTASSARIAMGTASLRGNIGSEALSGRDRRARRFLHNRLGVRFLDNRRMTVVSAISIVHPQKRSEQEQQQSRIVIAERQDAEPGQQRGQT